MTRILLIEDNKQLRDITTRILAMAGYKVLAADSGTLGVQAWRDHGADLVLTDVQLAGIDGFDVINEIRATAPGLPVILMSGDAKAGADLRCHTDQLHPVSFLAKPFLRTELLAVVTAALSTGPAADASKPMNPL